jgi:N-acylneuraminate cytidylyltransferase
MLCVIPARGGSKRIPRKNIKDFCGIPMIVRSIHAARQAKIFDKIIVSTDDIEIADIAKKNGVNVPFIRPENLSNDFAGTLEVIAHAIREVEIQDNMSYSHICCLYATAPFVRAEDLITASSVIKNKDLDFDFAIPVTTFPFPIQRAVKMKDDGSLIPFSNDSMMQRSQDLEEAYHDSGQFYFGKKKAWLEAKSIWSEKIAPVLLPRYLVQDIDTMEDWYRAELMYKTLYKNGAYA